MTGWQWNIRPYVRVVDSCTSLRRWGLSDKSIQGVVVVVVARRNPSKQEGIQHHKEMRRKGCRPSIRKRHRILCRWMEWPPICNEIADVLATRFFMLHGVSCLHWSLVAPFVKSCNLIAREWCAALSVPWYPKNGLVALRCVAFKHDCTVGGRCFLGILVGFLSTASTRYKSRRPIGDGSTRLEIDLQAIIYA